MSIIGNLLALEAVVALQVRPCGCVLATDGLMPWTVEDTERLDQLTAITLALSRTTVHVRHVVVVVKTVSGSDMKGVRGN